MKKYSMFFVLQIAVIFLVILIFKFIEPKQVAALWAGLTFLITGLFYFFSEVKEVILSKNFKNPLLWTSGFFWMFVALPMLIVRVFNWGVPFEQLTVMGLTGPVFHKLSNYFYLAMMVSTLIMIVKSKSKKVIV